MVGARRVNDPRWGLTYKAENSRIIRHGRLPIRSTNRFATAKTNRPIASPTDTTSALMGFSRIKLAVFIPISYAMNFLGILAVALIGEAVL